MSEGRPESVERLVEELSKLPGVGRRTAERLADHLVRAPKEEAMALAVSIRDVKKSVRPCSSCGNFAESDPCAICGDDRRDRTRICVVTSVKDLLALERAGVYRGLYHVLLGRIAPLEGIGPDQLTIEALVQRVRSGSFREIIMATNPTVEGDGTALYISNLLAELPVNVTRLARGITTGSILEYTNKEVLADALSGRQRF